MKLKSWPGRGTTKAGEFLAYCRKGEWVPLEDILRLPREEQPDTLQTRWDAKLKCEVGLAHCDFATADREAYAEHFKTVHRARQVYGLSETWTAGIKKMWRGPRLARDGKDLPKASTELVRMCLSCGLVAEVDSRAANVLWWDEHERGCRMASEAVAS